MLLFSSQTAYAQSSQAYVSVNLTSLKVQLTYPSEADPGQSVTVNVQARAQSSFKLDNLNLQVYVANPNDLLQLANVTVANDLQMSIGGQINKNIQVTVPSDAQRTSLLAKLSETVDMTVFIVYHNAEAAPYYSTISDDAIAPLTYIMATTPEYSALQAQFQALQSNFNSVQQTLNQTQAQNHQLQTTIAQQNATMSQLNQQLATAITTDQIYAAFVIVEGVFVIIAVAVAAFSFFRARKKAKLSTPT